MDIAVWHLRHRDTWIGWTDEKRPRRLALVAKASRVFSSFRDRTMPKLGSAMLNRVLARLPPQQPPSHHHRLSSTWRPITSAAPSPRSPPSPPPLFLYE